MDPRLELKIGLDGVALRLRPPPLLHDLGDESDPGDGDRDGDRLGFNLFSETDTS